MLERKIANRRTGRIGANANKISKALEDFYGARGFREEVNLHGLCNGSRLNNTRLVWLYISNQNTMGPCACRSLLPKSCSTITITRAATVMPAWIPKTLAAPVFPTHCAVPVSRSKRYLYQHLEPLAWHTHRNVDVRRLHKCQLILTTGRINEHTMKPPNTLPKQIQAPTSPLPSG